MNTSVEFGGPTVHSSLMARFAAQMGFFKRAGLDLNVRTVFGGPELADAYDSGAIKIGEMGSPPAITAIGKGKRLRIIGSSMRRGVALYFVTRPEIRTFADLKGKRLGALSLGSCSDWFLREMLSQNGIDVARDVAIEGLGDKHSQVLDLFAAGHIHGALLSGLNTAMGEARGVLRNWGPSFDLADLPRVQWSVYVANQTYIREQNEELQLIMATLKQAGRLVASDPKLWVSFTASLFGVDEKLAQAVYDMERPFMHLQGEVDREGLMQAMGIQLKLGAIPRALALDEMLAG